MRMVYFFSSFSLLVNAQNSTIKLNNGWQFCEAGKTTWLAASVPGEVHTDMLKNKLIQDPFCNNNYFDLIAGQQKRITFKASIGKPVVTILSLYDVINRNK